MWEKEIITGKISNHILVFGYNDAFIHFIKATRQNTDIPIVFFFNENIYLEVFKLNNVHGNIFHFYGDHYDKSHLDKSCIADAYSVIILNDYD